MQEMGTFGLLGYLKQQIVYVFRHIQGTVNIFIDETTIKGDPTDSIFASRHLLETTVRRLLLSRHENVSHIHGTAESVVGATNVGPLEGVNVHLFTGEETYLPAAIVVGKSVS